ncbi:group II intron reverse transcriptase/maturase [[Phormidium] sp. ETS-05]|uniref:group II intron reverse transcriptase/maturase n=1 Tax=[Phormidium] sp. ETS-05 TaxID=222819 RepID=UPI0031FE7C24
MLNAEVTTQDEITLNVEWHQVNWRAIERYVYKLQKQIYRASSCGNVRLVRRLQKLMLHSKAAKLLAVRRVTQDNQGKKTAGVDGVKSLTPQQRFELANNLKLTGKGKPTRRVWIPKPGTDEKRPLGIPTMYDRATQALVKAALEPEWEAKFEPNSYGFRPGRSCHDAIQAIFITIKHKAKFVLDADISKCFDKINHQVLLAKVGTFPKIRKQVKAWLKAGVLDGRERQTTDEGTPQGGVISPLLANIALHGMENRVKQFARTLPGGKSANKNALTLVRYADDFVILYEDPEVVKECQSIIQEWLKTVGLELKPAKTRLAHTLEAVGDEKPGFDFLGFNIRQYPVGKYSSGKNTHGQLLGFKTLIKPADKKVTKHYHAIAEVVNNHTAAPQAALISRLNPIIKGWSNYYSSQVSKELYSKLDHLVYGLLRRWARKRHPNKSGKWVADKYWHTIGGDNWTFAHKANGKIAGYLYKHAKTQIVRHVKVRGEASPYDGNLPYWATRLEKHPEIPTRVAKLLKVQKGKCKHCGLTFKPGDLWEVDHIIPKRLGGKDVYENLQLLHRHCHDIKTRTDGSIIPKPKLKGAGTHVKESIS